ncbi:MAG TPA: transporter [Steroidobacteraceae bacterium]|nr:transporter [Steroidobacteraceae bacterium]
MRSNILLPLAAVLLFSAQASNGNPTPENQGPADAPVESSVSRQSRDDAWWTGPLLAASPGTLTPGHFLIEPYIFDGIPQGHYDNDGNRHTGPHSNNFGSQSYILYGLTDKVGIGLIPRFGFNDMSEGRDSSKVGVGDLTLQAQYGLTHFEEGSWIPTTAFVVQETLPIGKYDRLGDRPADGLGAGAYSTNLALYSQYFFWMPNGRILRTRFDVSYQISGSTSVRDVSVYGTQDGFRGRARPGNVTVVNAAWEYSVTRNWVLALDVVYEHDSNTHVSGFAPDPVQLNSGPGHTWSLAPAIEYNFNSRVGVIAGAKLTTSGRNATAVIIPVAAVNIVI